MEREETEEKESVRKTEKERHEMKYKVGDKVRVRRDLERYRQYGKYDANRNMAELHGSIVEIKKVENEKQRYEINDNLYYWTDEMFEGLVEDELTAEEAIKIQAEMCSIPCGKCPISKEKGAYDCRTFRAEHPDKVLEILKQRKKEYEKKDVEVESKLYCRIIDGGDGSTVRSEALQDGINLNDEIKEILAKYCSEHVGDYFAVCENRWMVKQ